MSQMKIPKPQEQCAQAQESTGGIRGCGDPNCDICMPKGRPQDAGGAKGGAPEAASYTTTYIYEYDGARIDDKELNQKLLEQLRAAQERQLFEMLGRRGVSEQRKEPPRDPERERAIAEERALRPQVEKYFLQTKHSVGWDEVIGNETARAALIEAIEHPAKFKELYAHYGKKPTKGICLFGPPGCGKTMFGKAAAAALAALYKADVTLIKINGPEIQSPYVGVTEQIIRTVFAYARAYKKINGHPLVVFIDEADAILPSRDGAGGRRALPWEESNVATFLTEMDGMEESGALVILATNRPHAIDAALLRDGRCDRKIKVERPTREATRVIFSRCLAGVPIAPELSIDHLAGLATDFMFAGHRRLLAIQTDKGLHYLTLGDIVNGAMIGGIVEQAKAVAFARDIASGAPSGITTADLEAATDAVLKQNTGLDHMTALGEVVERIGCRAVNVVPLTMGYTPIVHEGTETRQ